MKNLFSLLALGAVTLGIFGCNKGPVTPPPASDAATLDITYEGTVNNALTIGNVPVEGGVYTISISSNRDWELIEIEDDIFMGLSISPKSGAKGAPVEVTITVPTNIIPDDPNIPGEEGAARSKGFEFRTIPEGDEAPLSRTVTIEQVANSTPEPQVITLASARMDYVADFEGNSSYWMMFQYENEEGGSSAIHLECVSDKLTEYLYSAPAAGKYEYAGDGVILSQSPKFSFTSRSYFLQDAAEANFSSDITGGEMSFTRNSDGVYDLEMEITVVNGEDVKVVNAIYDGPIYPFIYPDVETNVTGLTEWNDVTINKFKGNDNMWEVVMSSTDNNTSVRLVLNTEANLEIIPTGNFPMGTTPRAGVVNTAEPASIVGDLQNYDWGCWYFGDYDWRWNNMFDAVAQYAVPGEGSVNITKEGNLYTINFTFAGPDGHTVSGSCQKEIEVIDPNTFYLDFTSANIDYFSSNNTDVAFYWDGAEHGEKFVISLYTPSIDVRVIPEGTYTFSDGGNNPFTFESWYDLLINGGRDQIYYDGGTVKFTHVGDNYKVDFNVHFQDGRTLRGTYQGSIAES